MPVNIKPKWSKRWFIPYNKWGKLCVKKTHVIILLKMSILICWNFGTGKIGQQSKKSDIWNLTVQEDSFCDPYKRRQLDMLEIRLSCSSFNLLKYWEWRGPQRCTFWTLTLGTLEHGPMLSPFVKIGLLFP